MATPELKRRSKSYGDLSLERTADRYSATHRRHSSCMVGNVSFDILYEWINQPIKLHKPDDYSKTCPENVLLPSMDIPYYHTWHASSPSSMHQSKDIVAAIIAVAQTETESLGWVGIDGAPFHHPYHDRSPPSPSPPPPPPIENDTHIFDLLTMDDAYFIHYSQRPDQPCLMNSVTVEKLVEILTREMNSDLMMNFFLTFRQFLTPIKLCKLLILRFRWALLEDTDDRRLVRIRTFVVLRYWLTHYWEHDFMTSRTLRFMLCTFLSQLRTHPAILTSPRDARIIKSLRNLLKRQRKSYCTKLSTSTTRANLCTSGSNAISQPQQQDDDDHASLWLRRNRVDSSLTTSRSSSSSTSYHHYHPSFFGKNCKDSTIGIPQKLQQLQQQQQPHQQQQQINITSNKSLRSSTSTPTLPFLGRSRRLSTCSQRSVHEENAWTAKMNFGIKKIKRSVPTIYQSLVQGIHINQNHHHHHHHHQDHQQRHLSSGSNVTKNCICNATSQQQSHQSLYQYFLHHRSPKRSISRFFDQRHTVASSSASSSLISSASALSCAATALPPSPSPMLHHDPGCPFYTITPSTGTFSSGLFSPSSPPAPSTQPAFDRKRQQQCKRASYYSDGASTHVTHTTIGGRTVSSMPASLDDLDYRPFILTYRSEIIAQQFCMMEQSMLQLVTWDELAELRWRKRSKGAVISPDTEQGLLQDGVEQLIGFFNKTCQWVASEIVRTRSLDIRVRVIEKFIRIALKCYHHRNYSTLMQVLLGLQSPAVSRLIKTWQRIDHYEMQIFNELKELAKPFRNWKNVRDAMTKATEEIAESSAVECILTSKSSWEPPSSFSSIRGCIPFLGLYLSDLVFNAELPTFIDSSKLQQRQAPVTTDAGDIELCRRLGSHLVNYNKFRITASIIKHILAFQILCRSYEFAPHPDLLVQLQKMQLLDSTEIRKQSSLCEHDPC